MSSKKPKYIFITGGVVSSLGKGVAAASISFLLENHGFSITLIKIDPYINIDSGTMSPYQHGEVYVTSDGSETDLDLGHYERFTSSPITKDNSITTGKIYHTVIERERRGDYLGQTVQVIPHITDCIKEMIRKPAENKDIDFVIVELGGTVGDIEGLPFLEAIRQMHRDLGEKNVLYIHLTFIPYIHVSDEAKSKPTQHSVMKLRELGIQPNIIICRTEKGLNSELKDKISLFCDVPLEAIIEAPDVRFVYEVPLIFRNQNLDKIILDFFGLPKKEEDILAKRERFWQHAVDLLKNSSLKIPISIVGKYTKFKDAYKSIIEALYHGAVAANVGISLRWVEAGDLEKSLADDLLSNSAGIIVPGGFGYRGHLGKIQAINYARIKNIPFLGICLGMQCAVIEVARNLLSLKDADSTEFCSNTPNPVIKLQEEQLNITTKGATMRRGALPTYIKKYLGEDSLSLAYQAYEKELVYERYRHRYAVNPSYVDKLEEVGLKVSGTSPEGQVEIIELKNHPWFVGVQFHPEFQSKLFSPHPLFAAFMKAAKATFYKNES